MACCAHIWICHAILTPFIRRLWRSRLQSKAAYRAQRYTYSFIAIYVGKTHITVADLA